MLRVLRMLAMWRTSAADPSPATGDCRFCMCTLKHNTLAASMNTRIYPNLLIKKKKNNLFVTRTRQNKEKKLGGRGFAGLDPPRQPSENFYSINRHFSSNHTKIISYYTVICTPHCWNRTTTFRWWLFLRAYIIAYIKYRLNARW